MAFIRFRTIIAATTLMAATRPILMMIAVAIRTLVATKTTALVYKKRKGVTPPKFGNSSTVLEFSRKVTLKGLNISREELPRATAPPSTVGKILAIKTMTQIPV